MSLIVTLAVTEPFADCAEPHVVLFRAVPEQIEERARVDLVDAAGPPFPVGVAGVLPLPDGAALALASPELALRRAGLAGQWREHLPAVDARRFRPHVVIDRGLDPAAARALFTVRRRSFRPYEATAEAFVLWRDGAAWTELARIPFGDRC